MSTAENHTSPAQSRAMDIAGEWCRQVEKPLSGHVGKPLSEKLLYKHIIAAPVAAPSFHI